MSKIRIYNSLTRKKEEFVPIKEGRIDMYVCGPTVYDEPHIGHARSAFIFDVVRRYLAYKKYDVKFVRNVTDVDDKIINKASKAAGDASLIEKTKEVSKKYLDAYHGDMGLLGIAKPDKEPKATEYIPKMISFIEALIKNDCAYVSGGDVYFDIKKAKDYGKLSGQNLDKMESGARVAAGENKRDPLDFALWKSAKEGEPSWPSPWGEGRPGWHIECSVMSSDILGGEFDIHGGGIDLIFPHHENEIAQSEGAGKKFARYWMHNGLLTINNEKMAKSLGNYITIKDFLAKYKDPDLLKLLFLNAHYRHPVDYTEEKMDEMRAQKERMLILVEKINRVHSPQSTVHSEGANKEIDAFKARFEEAMDDDFNTPLALASLFDIVSYANKLMQGERGLGASEKAVLLNIKNTLSDLASILGLNITKNMAEAGLDDKEITKMIEDRNKARKEKDFKKSDDIRKALMEKGIILEDTKDGTTWRKKI